jgi:hypothetical protein
LRDELLRASSIRGIQAAVTRLSPSLTSDDLVGSIEPLRRSSLKPQGYLSAEDDRVLIEAAPQGN